MRKNWLILSAYATLFMLGIYISFYQYTIYLIATRFALDGAMMGLTIGVQSMGMAIAPLPLGALSAEIGKKRVILIAYSLLVFGMLAVGFADSYIQYLAASFFIGAGFAVLEATLSAVLADEFPDNGARHLNFSQVAFSVGALCGPLLTFVLLQQDVPVQQLYHGCAAVFLLLGGAYLFIQETRVAAIAHGERLRMSVHVTSFFKNKILLLLAASIFCYVGIENTTANFADLYFRLAVAHPNWSAAALSLFWAAMIPSRLLAGIFKKSTGVMFLGCAGLAFLSTILAMFVPNPVVKLAMFALCGFGCGPLWPLLMHQATRVSQGSSGAILNIMFSFCATGGAVLPVFAGILVNGGQIAGVYYVCAGVMILTVLFWYKACRAEKMHTAGLP